MVAHRHAVRLYVLLLLFYFLPCSGTAQTKPNHLLRPPVVTLPQGAVTRISSPDRKWVLTFEFPAADEPPSHGCLTGENDVRKLWIQRKESNDRTLVRDFERSLDISWSPDSQHFFVNDASGSGETRPYIYDPATLHSTNLAALVAKASPKAANYLNADHSYLEVKHWINSHEVLVKMMAYFSEPPPQRPGFGATYRIDLDGTIHKVHEGYWR